MKAQAPPSTHTRLAFTFASISSTTNFASHSLSHLQLYAFVSFHTSFGVILAFHLIHLHLLQAHFHRSPILLEPIHQARLRHKPEALRLRHVLESNSPFLLQRPRHNSDVPSYLHDLFRNHLDLLKNLEVLMCSS